MAERLQSSSRLFAELFLVSAVVFSVVGVLAIGLGLAGLYPPTTFFAKCYPLSDALECWFAYKLFSCYLRGDWSRAPGGALDAGDWRIERAARQRKCVEQFSILCASHLGRWQHPPLGGGSHASGAIRFSQLLHNVVFGCVILFIAWIMDEGAGKFRRSRN